MTSRIDNVKWTGFSSLPDAKSVKEPKYYLDTVSIDAYESDIYFVNNTDKVLSLVIGESLANEDDYKLASQGDIPSYIEDDWVFRDVQPKQGVKIGSQHIIYHSDGLGQIDVSVFETPNEVWRFREVTKGLFGTTVFLWENDELPKVKASGTEKLILDDKPVDMNKVNQPEEPIETEPKFEYRTTWDKQGYNPKVFIDLAYLINKIIDSSDEGLCCITQSIW